MDSLFPDLPVTCAAAASQIPPVLSKRLLLSTQSRAPAAGHTSVTAWSAHAPAGRGPESPIAKFIIGGLVTIVFELSGELLFLGAASSVEIHITREALPARLRTTTCMQLQLFVHAPTLYAPLVGGHFIEFLKIAKQTSNEPCVGRRILAHRMSSVSVAYELLLLRTQKDPLPRASYDAATLQLLSV